MAFTIRNYADANADGHVWQAAPDQQDFEIIRGASINTGVVSGGTVTTGVGMSVDVAAGSAKVRDRTVSWVGTNLAVGAAASDTRIDLVVVDATGTLSVIAGTAAIVPVQPTASADTYCCLAALHVEPADVSVQADGIVDKRMILMPAIPLAMAAAMGVALG